MAVLELKVDFWDVGYGDASVLWIGENRLILIDCGPSNSRLPLWIEKHGFQVDLIVLTHNDADHIEGFLTLMRMMGAQVGAYAWVQDRPAEMMRSIWKELKDGRDRMGWPDPIVIAPRKGRRQDLLNEAQVCDHTFGELIQLEAIYPSHLDNLEGQTKGPNLAGALVVLSLGNKSIVAWPGDLPFSTCHEVLTRFHINPYFLVGPHHGGPIDIGNLSEDKVRTMAIEIGHQQVWISVAWRENYRHPREEYIKPLSRHGLVIRCSQLTPRCDQRWQRFAPALVPTHDWLGLEPPPKGPSCMGSMRVRFQESGFTVEYASAHKSAIAQLETPLCDNRAS